MADVMNPAADEVAAALTRTIASLTVRIYTCAIPPFPDWRRQACAGALVLPMIVLSRELGVR